MKAVKRFSEGDIARMRVMLREGASLRAVAAALGCTAPGVHYRARKCGMAVRTLAERGRERAGRIKATPEMIAELRERAAARQTLREMADAFGVCTATIINWTRLFDIPRPPKRAAKASADAVPAIPVWVPFDLTADFVDHAVLYGEYAAASHVRALKREAVAG